MGRVKVGTEEIISNALSCGCLDRIRLGVGIKGMVNTILSTVVELDELPPLHGVEGLLGE